MVTAEKSTNKDNYLKKKKLIILFTSILLIIIISSFGYNCNKHNKNKELIKNLLETMSYVETKMNIPHKFLALSVWFKFVETAENTYFLNYNEYIEPEKISENIGSDFKIVNDISKIETNGKDFIKNFSTKYIATLDSTYFKYQFELGTDKKSYTLKIMENQELNYDGDISDYFIFNSSEGFNNIVFKDNDKKMDFDKFYNYYSGELIGKTLIQNK